MLVDSVHWLKSTDLQIMQYLCKEQIPHQVVLSKVDKLLFPKETKAPLTEEELQIRFAVVEKELKSAHQRLGNMSWLDEGGKTQSSRSARLIACAASAGKWKHLGEGSDGALGIDTLRWSILQAVGLASAGVELISERL